MVYSIKSFITLPFSKQIDNELRKALHKLCITLVYKTINKFNCLIRLGKDKCKHTEKTNVIYKIDCKACDAMYVGQTSRSLNTRVKEHEADCQHKRNKSAIVNHVSNNNHSINFDNVNILDNESNLSKRFFIILKYTNLQLHMYKSSRTINSCSLVRCT